MTSEEPTGDGPAAEVVAVEVVEAGPPALPAERAELQSIYNWAKLMHASGYFSDAKSAAQAAVKIAAGRELGFSVVASMTGVHIIEGKPTIGANLMAAALKRHPRYDYRVIVHDLEACEIEVHETAADGTHEILGVSTYTIDDARRAGLLGRKAGMWEKFPRNMLFARAISNAIAFFAPDVFEGSRVYTADEANPDIELDAHGEPVGVEAPEPREALPEQAAAASKPPSDTRPPPQPKQPQQRRQRQERTPVAPDAIKYTEDLFRWANETHGLQPADVLTALDAENTGAIAREWREDWPAAVALVNDYAAATSADREGSDAAEADEHAADDAQQHDHGNEPEGDADAEAPAAE